MDHITNKSKEAQIRNNSHKSEHILDQWTKINKTLCNFADKSWGS